MNNPYYNQTTVLSISKIIESQLPKGLETTADLLLDFMSKSNDGRLKDMAKFIKASKNSEEIGMVFNFAMSLLQHDVTPLREAIYDTGIDGIKELKNHLTEKYGKDENMIANTKAFNFINWLILRLPAKEEMMKLGLIY